MAVTQTNCFRFLTLITSFRLIRDKMEVLVVIKARSGSSQHFIVNGGIIDLITLGMNLISGPCLSQNRYMVTNDVRRKAKS